MKNYIFVGLAVIALIGLLNTVGDNRTNEPMPNTVATYTPGVVVLDGRDTFFQSAGMIAVAACVLLIALIFLRGPHKNSSTTRETAVIAAIVLCVCGFGLLYLTHSGQGELFTLLFDSF